MKISAIRLCVYSYQCSCLWYSLSEYADNHGHLSESRVWGILVDLLKVTTHTLTN